LNELELIARFKQQSFLRERSLAALMKDADLAPELIKRRKFHLRGEKVRNRAMVGRIFARCTGSTEK